MNRLEIAMFNFLPIADGWNTVKIIVTLHIYLNYLSQWCVSVYSSNRAGHCGKHWQLLFRAASDGFSGHSFHHLCDNQGPTVVLVKVSCMHVDLNPHILITLMTTLRYLPLALLHSRHQLAIFLVGTRTLLGTAITREESFPVQTGKLCTSHKRKLHYTR